MRRVALLAVLTLLTMAGVALAEGNLPFTSSDEPKSPTEACTDEQTADPEAFAAKYGTDEEGTDAFANCVSSLSDQADGDGDDTTDSTEDSEETSEADEEEAEDAETADDAGDESQAADEDDADDDESSTDGDETDAEAAQSVDDSLNGEGKNPAQLCRELQSQWESALHDGESFAEYYGTNHNHANAYGKCVSAHATGAVTAAEESAEEESEVTPESKPQKQSKSEKQDAKAEKQDAKGKDKAVTGQASTVAASATKGASAKSDEFCPPGWHNRARC